MGSEDRLSKPFMQVGWHAGLLLCAYACPAAAATTAKEPSPPGMPRGICAAGYRCMSERCQVLARGQDDIFDTLLARPLRHPGARGHAPARPGIDKQHRLSRPADGAPATTQQLALDSFSPYCGLSR
jgi:hypothetical protein